MHVHIGRKQGQGQHLLQPLHDLGRGRARLWVGVPAVQHQGIHAARAALESNEREGEKGGGEEETKEGEGVMLNGALETMLF